MYPSLSLSLACLHTYVVLNTYTHLYFGKDRANFLFVFLIIPLQESAREKSQKYKEGKFVLERYMRYVSLLYIQIPFFFWLGGWHPAGSFIYTVTICVSIYNRGRIVDEIDFSTEVYIDTRPSVSDAEEWSSETAKFVASFLQNVVPNILTIRTDALLLYIYVWAVYLFGTTLALLVRISWTSSANVLLCYLFHFPGSYFSHIVSSNFCKHWVHEESHNVVPAFLAVWFCLWFC